MKTHSNIYKSTFIYIIVCFFHLTKVSAQDNILLNPSLEDTLKVNNLFKYKYNTLGDQFKNCKNWHATHGVVYKNRQKHNYIKTPESKPHKSYDGDCHAQLYSRYYDSKWALNGFLIGKLKHKLLKDSLYRYSYIYKQQQDVAFTLNSVQSSFISSPEIHPNKTYIINEHTTIDTLSNGWQKISGLYKATGGESFLALGHFSVSKTDYKKTKKHRKKPKLAITLLDLAEVLPTYKTIEKQSTPLVQHDELKVYFEHNSAQISDKEKHRISREIHSKKHNNTIEIYGYANVKGTTEHNLKLSQQRAEAIKTYLIKIGVKNHIKTFNGGILTSKNNIEELRHAVKVFKKFLAEF